MTRIRIARDFSFTAFWAGISTIIFMVFGGLTLQVSVIQRFNLPDGLAQSWIVVTWLTASVVSLWFILRYRQPLGIGWTIPGLVYMSSLAGQFRFEELVTADLVAGVAIMVLGLLGIGSKVIRFIPLPILMAMFAASIVDFIAQMMDAAAADFVLAGPMIGAYLVGRRLNSPRIPPVGLSVILGAVLVLGLGRYSSAALHVGVPELAMPGLAFNMRAIAALSIPMVVLVVGLGNVQGLGFLIAQGYRVPANGITLAVGLMTVVNALFGGHPAAMTRVASAILGGPSAGPLEKRYWAALVAFALALAVSLASGLVVAIIGFLPTEYILVVAGLAILPSFEDALVRAFAGPLKFGSTLAFGMAMSSFAVAGIPAAFWALLVGIGGSLILERDELMAQWGYTKDSSPERDTAKSRDTAGLAPRTTEEPLIKVAS